MVWSGRPSGWRRISSPDSIAPTVRLTLRTCSINWTFSPRSSAGPHFSIRRTSSAFSRPWSCFRRGGAPLRPAPRRHAGSRLKSRPRAFQCAMPFRVSSRSERPISSSNCRDAELRHDRARFLGDEEEEVDDVLGAALELRAQHRVLRRHPDRAGVEVALAHHDAALGDQRRGREAELVGAEQRADDDVAPGLHLAVGLHADAAAQAVQHQRLLRLGEAELPRRAGVLDRAPRRRAGAAVVAGDHDVVGLRLRDTGGDRADADFRDELDADARARIRVLQIVDQLRQVLDRVDVVMRRRRDQPHARHRVAQPADVLADLAARQLAALARLGALRHLDLQLIGARPGTRSSRRSGPTRPA